MSLRKPRASDSHEFYSKTRRHSQPQNKLFYVDWSPWRKWWMDIVKSGVVFAVGAIATVFILGRVDDERIKERFVAQNVFQLRMSTIDEFRTVTMSLSHSAYEAYMDYQMNNRDPSVPSIQMNSYKNALQNFNISFDKARTRFPNVNSLAVLDTITQSFDSLYSLIIYRRGNAKTQQDALNLIDSFKVVRLSVLPHLEAVALQSGFQSATK